MKSAVQERASLSTGSWVDHLIRWIEGLPLPSWLFYGLLVVGSLLFLNAVFWLDGSLPAGSFDPLISSFSVWVMYWLAAYHYLTRVGARALEAFRPLLDAEDSEIARLHAQLATLPAWLGWLTIPFGIGIGVLTIVSDPDPYGSLTPNTPIPRLGDMIVTSFMLATFLAVVIRSIRQLRMVARLHDRATNVDLLDLGPAHAFSALTARTGGALILVLILGTLQDPQEARSTVSLLLSVGVALAAIAVFVVPLVGMQAKLEEEKGRALGEINELLRMATQRLRRKITEDDYEKMAGTKEALDALKSERDRLERTSTWPWNPRTIRGFGSTLVLPIVLWIATRLLEDLF